MKIDLTAHCVTFLRDRNVKLSKLLTAEFNPHGFSRRFQSSVSGTEPAPAGVSHNFIVNTALKMKISFISVEFLNNLLPALKTDTVLY